MNQAFLDYYRCPQTFAAFELSDRQMDQTSPASLTFILDSLSILEGGQAHSNGSSALSAENGEQECFCKIPFNPTEVADDLRLERYVNLARPTGAKAVIRQLYYLLRPFFPVPVRRHLQKLWLKGWKSREFPRWPVDRSVDQMFEGLMRLSLLAAGGKKVPFIWFWPQGKSDCAMMTHDVETQAGLQFAEQLMNINDSFSIKSSFQLIPDARYVVDDETLSLIKSRGFEVNVHDLKHDGHLFEDQEQFRKDAVRINEFGTRFGSKGFRSAILYRNQAWYDALEFSYDMSVPNVGHLDPQPGGCCTVMPYFVGKILELPLTATQDYTLFHVLNSYSLDLWRSQIHQIQQQHGLISFIVHPDYLNTVEARHAYTGLLAMLAELRDKTGTWIALPGQVNTWWRQRSEMQLVPEGEGWRIEGPGAERATLAYAALNDGKVCYEFA